MNKDASIKREGGLPLLWLFAALVVAAPDIAPLAIAPTPAAGDFDTYYIVSHRGFTIAISGFFCLFAAIYAGLRFIPAIQVRPALGYVHLAIALVGAALVRAPLVAFRLAAPQRLYADPVAMFAVWNQLAAIGYGLLLASLLLFLLVLSDGLRRRPS